jgi:M6 family metalloprotease-like protein
MKSKFSNILLRGLFSVAFFLFSIFLYSMEPPTANQLERYRADGSLRQRIEAAKAIGNHFISPGLVRDFLRRMARYDAQAAGETKIGKIEASSSMPTTGLVRIFVLPIAFSDYPSNNSIASLRRTIFGEGNPDYYPCDGLRTFYLRSSYGQLELTGAVLDWYTTPYPRSEVRMDDAGREALIVEALNYHKARGHDFSQYDNNGDAVTDYFAVIWTGPSGDWATFWWGYQTWFQSNFELDGKRFFMYSWQAEGNVRPNSFSPYALIHETGHALGLPDYYDYDPSVGPKGGVGQIDIMDGMRGDHNCFSKCLLGWMTPVFVGSGSHTAVLRESALYPDAVIFMPNVTGIYSEFFIVQNRSLAGNDKGLPGKGLLVWHVDARVDPVYGNFLYNNSFTDHKLLQLVQADGLDEIEILGEPADADDYYRAGDLLGPDTRPHTGRYDSVKTYGMLSGISEVGAEMTCDISVGIHPPMDFAVVRHENRSVFLWEYILDFSWGLNPANQYFPVEVNRIYRLEEGTRVKVVDLPVNETSYRIRPVYQTDQEYAIVSVTDQGLESYARVITTK